MWPLDRPARDVLKLPGETVIPWAVFDWQWYLRTYPEAATVADEDDPSTVLTYYLERGQKQGHSPNRMFDEQWHRQMYPQIAERVAAGHWPSAFDAYCRRGALDRSPHWLFDELAYRDRYPDLTNAVLEKFELCNGYDHYLRHGIAEDRIGHRLFDPKVYLSHFDPADAAAIRENGIFQHYLNRIRSGEPELRTSIYFDPEWYLRRYPGRRPRHRGEAVEMRAASLPLQRYANRIRSAGKLFGVLYLGRDPGLRAVVEARTFRNGYIHFLRFGAKELRPPIASIDLAWYAAQPSVKADLEQGRAPDAFAHWLAIGSAAGLPAGQAGSGNRHQIAGAGPGPADRRRITADRGSVRIRFSVRKRASSQRRDDRAGRLRGDHGHHRLAAVEHRVGYRTDHHRSRLRGRNPLDRAIRARGEGSSVRQRHWLVAGGGCRTATRERPGRPVPVQQRADRAGIDRARPCATGSGCHPPAPSAG